MGVMRVYDHNPDVNDENLGIRAFQIKRAKAVERSMQLIRHGLQAQWGELNTDEIEELEWVLGELWAYVARAHWDDLRFGLLTMRDIIKILTLGSQMRRHARSNIEILREIDAIISSETPYQAPSEA